MSNNQFKIIVVDDDKCTSDTLAEILTDEGFSAVAVESTREVLDLLKEQHWDLIISDVHRPGRDLDGIGMLKKIRSEGNQIPIILLTGFATIEITVEAMKSGVTDFLTKPTNAHKLFTAIRSALSATTRSNQVEALQPSIKNVLGVKPRIIAVDDDRDIQNLIAQLLNEAGYNAVTAGCNEEVSKILQSSTIDLIISDVMHPGGTGVELLQGIRKLGFNIPVILVTGCSMIDMAIEGIRAGASDFIIKPFTQNDLMCAVQRVLGHRSSILMERMYYPTGIIKREEYYPNEKGEILVREYSEEGRLLAELSFKNGKYHGVCRVYHNSASLLAECEYKDGLEDGVSRWFTYEGKIRVEYVHKKGDRISRVDL